MTKLAQIYLLREPGTERVRYVGYTTKTLEQRLALHYRKAQRAQRLTHCQSWLLSLETPPRIELIEWVTSDGEG